MLGNQLHALALSEGLCRKKKLFTKKGRVELQSVGRAPWASRRRAEPLQLLPVEATQTTTVRFCGCRNPLRIPQRVRGNT